jgi:hypothetical protein
MTQRPKKREDCMDFVSGKGCQKGNECTMRHAKLEEKGRCYVCGQHGHHSRNCWAPMGSHAGKYGTSITGRMNEEEATVMPTISEARSSQDLQRPSEARSSQDLPRSSQELQRPSEARSSQDPPRKDAVEEKREEEVRTERPIKTDETKQRKNEEEENRQEVKQEDDDDQRTGSVTRTMLMDPESEQGGEPMETEAELKASDQLRKLLFKLRLNPTTETENVKEEIEEICRGIEKRNEEEEQKKKGSNKLRKKEDPKG